MTKRSKKNRRKGKKNNHTHKKVSHKHNGKKKHIHDINNSTIKNISIKGNENNILTGGMNTPGKSFSDYGIGRYGILSTPEPKRAKSTGIDPSNTPTGIVNTAKRSNIVNSSVEGKQNILTVIQGAPMDTKQEQFPPPNPPTQEEEMGIDEDPVSQTDAIIDLRNYTRLMNNLENDILFLSFMHPFYNETDYQNEIENKVYDLIYGPIAREDTEKEYNTKMEIDSDSDSAMEQLGGQGNQNIKNAQRIFELYCENDSEHDFFKGERAIWNKREPKCNENKADIQKIVQPLHTSNNFIKDLPDDFQKYYYSLQENKSSEGNVLSDVLEISPTTNFFCKYIHFKDANYKDEFFNFFKINSNFKIILLQKYFIIPKFEEKNDEIVVDNNYIYFIPNVEAKNYDSDMIYKIYKDMGIKFTSCICAFFLENIQRACLESGYNNCLGSIQSYDDFCKSFKTNINQEFNNKLPFAEIKHIAKYLDPISTTPSLSNDDYNTSISLSSNTSSNTSETNDETTNETTNETNDVELDDIQIQMPNNLELCFKLILYLLFNINVLDEEIKTEPILNGDDIIGVLIEISYKSILYNPSPKIEFYFKANTVDIVSETICDILKGALSQNTVFTTARQIYDIKHIGGEEESKEEFPLRKQRQIKILTTLKTFGDLFQLVLAYVTNVFNDTLHAFYTQDRLCISMGLMLYKILNPILQGLNISLNLEKNYLPVFFLSSSKGLEKYPQFSDVEIDDNISPDILKCETSMISQTNETFYNQYTKQVEFIKTDFRTILMKNINNIEETKPSIIEYINNIANQGFNFQDTDDLKAELTPEFKEKVNIKHKELKEIHDMLLFQKHYDIIVNYKETKGIFAKIFNCFSFTRKESQIKKIILDYSPHEWSDIYGNKVYNYIQEVLTDFQKVVNDCNKSKHAINIFETKVEEAKMNKIKEELRKIKTDIENLESITEENKITFCKAINVVLNKKMINIENIKKRQSTKRKNSENYVSKEKENDIISLLKELQDIEYNIQIQKDRLQDINVEILLAINARSKMSLPYDFDFNFINAKNKDIKARFEKNNIKIIEKTIKDIKRKENNRNTITEANNSIKKQINEMKKLNTNIEKLKNDIIENTYGRDVKSEDIERINKLSKSLGCVDIIRGGKHKKSRKNRKKITRLNNKKTKRKTKRKTKHKSKRSKKKYKTRKKHKITRKKKQYKD